jgi:hypothetical protein
MQLGRQDISQNYSLSGIDMLPEKPVSDIM